jgi:hypothetical protein
MKTEILTVAGTKYRYGDIFCVTGRRQWLVLTRPNAVHAALESLTEWQGILNHDGSELESDEIDSFSMSDIIEMFGYPLEYVGYNITSCPLLEALTIISRNPLLATHPATKGYDPDIGYYVTWSKEVNDFVFWEDLSGRILTAASLHRYLDIQEWCVIKRPRE